LDFAHAVFLRIFVLGRCIKLSQTGNNASTIGQQNLEKKRLRNWNSRRDILDGNELRRDNHSLL
jgi:hypothetical protein